MSKLLQIGIVFAAEMRSGIGHMACTLGGVNYECRGSRGCLKGSAARGAANPLFRHHFHRMLTDAQATAAKKFADDCLGLPYRFGEMPVLAPPPGKGCDCSAYMSAIYSAAVGKPIVRRFATGNWMARFKDLGFAEGLGGGLKPGPTVSAIGVLDRPFPGTPVGLHSPKKDHVKWIQARLNFAAGNKHAVLGGQRLVVDGDFGTDTEKVVIAFQKSHGLQGLGMCGPKTWPFLNAVR
jgi:hypothetical protein